MMAASQLSVRVYLVLECLYVAIRMLRMHFGLALKTMPLYRTDWSFRPLDAANENVSFSCLICW